jgi:hypothetical protein
MSRSTAWAAKYHELFSGFLEELGGDRVPPVKRAFIRQLAVVETEISMMGDRFANAQSTSEELGTYMRLGDKSADLRRCLGIDHTITPVQHAEEADEARQHLHTLLSNLIRVRLEEESQGVFREPDGLTFVTDPARIELKRQIYALQQREKALASGAAEPELTIHSLQQAFDDDERPAQPERRALPAPQTAAPAPAPTAEEPKAPPAPSVKRAAEPEPPKEPTATELFYQWDGHGSTPRIDNWSPGPSWRGY